MKPEAQRIAIQEVMGWQPKQRICSGGSYDVWTCSTPSKFDAPPDYLSDLNAIQSACVQLFGTDQDKWLAFDSALLVASGWKVIGRSQCAAKYSATPAMWSEAFLKTLNLWTP